MSHPHVSLSALGERALLKHLRDRLGASEGVVLGLGDDAAAVRTGSLTLVTTDCLVEGRHFRCEWSPPQWIGRKAMNANLSDIAAMGGRARYATISLCLRRDVTLGFVDGLYDGLIEVAGHRGVAIVGGNVSSIDGPLVVDVTLLGAPASEGRMLVRSAAQPGDRIGVTGAPGTAAAGLRLLERGARLGPGGVVTGVGSGEILEAARACLKAQLDPCPPLDLGEALAREGLVRCAMDVSDGLSADLMTLCEESRLGARIDASALPIGDAERCVSAWLGQDPLDLALHGGEDYGLVLAVPEAHVPAAAARARSCGTSLTIVGRFETGAPGIALHTASGTQALRRGAWDHFRSDEPR